jgi:WD40 repeat protein
MAKVFISYSRKDIEFAKRLTEELKKSDLDFWVDWEGIPPTVDWWKQIEKGIEEADVFLFLISPDSAKSKVCGEEIDCAVKNGKRLIPLIVRDIQWDETPLQLGHLNYIFFRESDEFDVSIKKLLTAIHTDYEWAQTHRRLQVKALEWERINKENSFLLRGKDLQEAELQLATNTSKDPHPTDLQRDYVFKSRQAADRQRRIIMIGSIASAIVMAVLAVFAFVQLNISRAQNIGSQAQVAFAEQDYNTALLYAYQSNLIHKNNAADLLLGQIVYKNFPTGKQLNGHTADVNSVAWSSNGQLASGSSDGTVIIWDIKTRQPAQILKGSTAFLAVNSVAWSSDGQLASGSSDGTVIIWDIKTGQPGRTLKGHTDAVTSVAWSSDGQLASGSNDGSVIIWDLKTGQSAQSLKGHTDAVTSLAWSADGQLASGSNDGSVIIWDLKSGQPVQTLKSDSFPVTSVAWSADGQLVSGSTLGLIVIWDLKKGLPSQTLSGIANSITSVAWSAGGQLASGSLYGAVTIWNLKTSQPAQNLNGYSDNIYSVSWSADGQLASGSNDGTVVVWNLKTDQTAAQTLKGQIGSANNLGNSAKNLGYGFKSVTWSTDGKLASGSLDGVTIWDLKTGQPTQTLRNYPIVNSVAWSADGQLASGPDYDHTVIIWDLQTGQHAQTLTGHTEEVTSLAWSSDGHLASGAMDKKVIIWDLKTGKPAKTLMGHTDYVFSVAWSADGQLASGSNDGTVIIWDLQTGQPAQILKRSSSGVISVAWSPDGQLASGSNDGIVTIWDLKTGKPAQTLKGHTDFIRSVAWSADGQLASGSNDGTVIIWGLKTGRPAQTLKGHTRSVSSVAWSPYGQLTSGSDDNTIQISRADLTGGNPCDKILRNMTIQEWMDYQGMLYVYKPACPNLHNPTDLTLEGFLNWIVFTWMGRAILLALLSTILAFIFFTIWLFNKSVTWIWRKLRNEKVPSKR